MFPGGNFDRKQDTSLVMTAIRETFEESGILLASPASDNASTILTDEVLDEARRNIHSQKLSFQAFLSSQNMRPDVDSLLPFTQWITPANAPRYDQLRDYSNIRLDVAQAIPYSFLHCLPLGNVFTRFLIRGQTRSHPQTRYCLYVFS